MTGWEIGVVIVFVFASIAYVVMMLGQLHEVGRASNAEAERTHEIALAAMEREMFMAALEKPTHNAFTVRGKPIPHLLDRDALARRRAALVRRTELFDQDVVPVADAKGGRKMGYAYPPGSPIPEAHPDDLPSEITEPTADTMEPSVVSLKWLACPDPDAHPSHDWWDQDGDGVGPTSVLYRCPGVA